MIIYDCFSRSGVEDDQAVISTHQLDEGIQLSTEEIFVQRPDDLDDDDVFPLYLTGSKSKSQILFPYITTRQSVNA